MEKINLSVIPTIDLAKEIIETAEVLFDLVLAEQKLSTVMEISKIASGPEMDQLVIRAQAEMDQLVCHRREGMQLLIEMTEEHNARPDRHKDLPIDPSLRKMAEL